MYLYDLGPKLEIKELLLLHENDTILPIGKSLFERGKGGQSNRRLFTASVGHGQIYINEVCFIKS